MTCRLLCILIVDKIYGTIIIDLNTANNTTINNEIILQSLREFKIDPVLAGRNDIHLNGKKISGSAYQLSLETRNSPTRLALHHGTMLLSCNFEDVGKYLMSGKSLKATKDLVLPKS